jgi:DNA polymerase III subunit delta'
MYPYPWQEKQWQHLVDRKQNNTLPHALLLTGCEGLGKLAFAKAVAGLLLCKQPINGKQACGHCTSCKLFNVNNHPDLILVHPEAKAKSKNIKVDQIREIIRDAATTSQQGGYQIVIIEPADTMNIAAANALLKTLEEPEANVVIMLVTAKPKLLPATISSRCQQISFYPPRHDVAKQWLADKVSPGNDLDLLLEYASNVPLLALQMLNDKSYEARNQFFDGLSAAIENKISCVSFAENCSDFELSFVVMNLFNIILDVLKLKYYAESAILNKDRVLFLKVLVARTTPLKLFAYLDQLTLLNQYLNSNINLNKQLAIEVLIIKFATLID